MNDENQSCVKFIKIRFHRTNVQLHKKYVNVGHILCSFYIIASLSLQDYCILSSFPMRIVVSFAHDKTHILSFSEDLLTLGESVSFSNSRSKGGRVASRRRGREGCGRADEKRGKGELHCFFANVFVITTTLLIIK